LNDSPVQVLDRVLRSCCRSTGVDGAGFSIVSSSGTHEPLYASNDVADEIERLQVILGEGPCIDASTLGTPVLVRDLTESRDEDSSRWPLFRNEAVRIGARAIFAFPIRIGAISLGAVDLYRETAGPLSHPELSRALNSMDEVGLAVLEAPDYYGDADAPTVINMTVHQAAGRVMAQLDSTIEEAVVRLRAAAFAEGVSLTELAKDVVDGRRRFAKETR
jgi:hypothetical protein